MDAINNWAFSVMAIMLISAVFRFLIPSGKVKKAAGIALSATVLVVMLSPIFSYRGTEIYSDIPIPESEQYSDDGERYTLLLTQTVEDLLTQNGIRCNSVTADAELGSDKVLKINTIHITLSDISDTEKAEKILDGQLGLEGGCLIIDGQ